MKFEKSQPGHDSTSFMEIDLEITGEDGGTVKAKYDGVDEELVQE